MSIKFQKAKNYKQIMNTADTLMYRRCSFKAQEPVSERSPAAVFLMIITYKGLQALLSW